MLFLNFVFAEEIDFSLIESQDGFLKPVNLPQQRYVVDKEFIFPLGINNQNSNILVEQKEKKETPKNEKNNSGWNYVVKKGENLWSISKKFKVSFKDLLIVNNLNEKSVVKVGDKIVIPGVKPQAIISLEKPKQFAGKFVSALKEVGGLVIPVSGLNWGHKHGNNATDIAADCGQEVYATAEGRVVESSDGWNGGYGNYIIISHQNGVYSLYGHLSLRLVEIGEEVDKGQLIGYVGNTGFTIGETGCHLHFEIRGKTNPLLR